MSYFDNLRVIAQGDGSDQARACRDRQCKICSEILKEKIRTEIYEAASTAKERNE